MASHVDALVVLLDRINLPLLDRTIAFLQQLRLFRQCNCLSFIETQTTLTSIRENSQIVNLSDNFPVPFPRPLLIPTCQSDLRFARKLRAIEICDETLVVEVLQAIGGRLYSNDEVRKFMVWFLTNIYKFQANPIAISHAKNICFVPNGIGFCKPAELYDPRDAHLQVLFKEENKFPVGEFTSEKYINAMAQLGLKKRQDISANCVYTTANKLDRMCRDCRDVAYISQKANALFQLLEEKHDILWSTVTHTGLALHSSVSQLKCILHEREKPNGYPKSLVWKGSEYILCSPAELKSETFAQTIGSLIPLVKAPEALCRMFQWNAKPGAKDLTEQLHNIIAAYSSVNKPDLLPLISNVYKAMSEQCSEVIKCQEFQGLLQKNCIWWGDAFCLPNQIILEKKDNDIDLQPYMFPLPAELQTLRSFFSEIGCYLRQDTSALLSVQAMIAENHLKHDPNDENKTRKDLHIVLQILNKLYQDNVNIADIGEKLLFPVHTGDTGKLVLKPYTECTYCDAQWLKDLTDEDEEDEDEILYVHRDVLPSVAEGLGVKSLKKQLMSDAEGLEEWGQKEPLTRRLHNILKDGYVDGLAVPKEIIQNADDARAATVKFLYDERENADARTQLLDEGMADCQGPALWAYNDALFSNDDLKNIIKLSGATKESDTTKIGKFGLGFCAVYNLTDVPSFVSGQNMVIFDPHMKYLNSALPGKSPGLKINLQKMKNKRLMKRMNNQFKPFQGVFGCDLSHDEPFFNGTLFRFPLRTPVQAGSSEIKNASYTKEEMVTLLKKFVETSGNMMLFTQNLQCIKLFHIPASGVHPNDAQLLCTVSKDTATEHSSESMLDICSKLKLKKELHFNPLATIQKIILILKCERAIYVLGDVKADTFETNWLVSWATGTQKSLALCYSTTMAGALPLGSVAMLVETGKEQLTPKPLVKAPFGYYNTGHIFCYLPLPVQCKLNVHLNGSFAVTSNRRGLQTNTEDDKYSYDTQWNDALLSDAVANAFINLLVRLHEYKTLQYTSLSENYKFFQMWPTECPPLTMGFKKGFYRNVVASDSTVFESYNKWLGLKHCLFLKTEMSSDSDIWGIALSTLQRYRSNPSSGVVNLPSEYFCDLQSTDGWKDNAVIVEEQDFFLSYFLPNITDMFWQESRENLTYRNKLLLYCLAHSNQIIDAALREIECIPTSHDGTLRKPRDLVHPDSRLSPLFSEEDCRFPEQSFRTYAVLRKLLDLGMMQDLMQADLVIERASSIENLFSKELFSSSYARCKHLIGYLAACRDLDNIVLQKLGDIQFLPVLRRPNSWPFRWAADNLDFKKQNDVVVYFEKPCNLFLDGNKDLVACSKYILDVHGFPYSIYNTQLFGHLGVKTHSNITLELVIVQLLNVCNYVDFTRSVSGKRIEDQVFDNIYRFLDDKASRDPDGFKSVLPHLKDKPVIRLESKLLPVSKVALFVGHCCTPELYEIGKSKVSEYRTFLKQVGVKDYFDVLDVVQILRRKKNEFGICKLPQNELNLIRQLLELLSDIMQKSHLKFSDISHFGEESIVAPDIDMVLWPTNMLCHDDLDFSEKSSSMRFVHGNISRNVAEVLGISTKKRTYLKDCEIGEPFEQKEELVTRLRGLLDGYPCDIGIMKELIQNADDANANEIHFIKDFRTHRCENIFDNDYKEFQGPALLVYNDSPFSKADLKGIRNLGVGSKHEDPAKTGQYGVGFNAVYNLTDLPSFLTKGPEVEEGETLCLFDPLQKHCKGVAGKRYSTKKVRTAFPDILSGYSEENVFGSTNIGTVFRFPLRLSKSDISNTIVTIERLNEIMNELKLELPNLLLFVRSVTKIIVSDISTGSLKKELSVSVELDDSNTQKRIDFSLRCKERAKLIKTSKSVEALHPPSQITYNLTLKEGEGKEQEWFVVQRLGISENIVPQHVKTAIENGQLGMLPVGGIALHIPRKGSRQSIRKSVLRYMFSTSSQVTATVKRGRLYCFLPLPLTTGLPMHINGHFVLDHEARRRLWCDENEKGYKSSWNFLLLSDIVARSYLEALKFLKENIFADGNTQGYSKQHFHEHINDFHTYFPYGKIATDNYEKFLGQSIFKMIINEQEELFPIPIRRETTENREKAEAAYHVKWSSFHPDGHQFPVHFANVNDFPFGGGLDDLLIALGFKLTLCSPELIQSMSDYACSVKELNPGVVIQFLKSHSSPFCDRMQINAIPSQVGETKFENIRNVEHILSFCSTAETFLNDLNGLPLLVTNDGMLRCFDTNQTIYCTKYCRLLPKSASHFVHKHIVHKINSIVDGKNGVRQQIPLTKLEEFLTTEMNDSKYTQADLVTFDPLSNIPGQTWLIDLWELILQGFERANANGSADFNSYLIPLQKWCLIPTVKDNADNVLVKIEKAFSVVDCESFSCFPALEAILRQLGLPRLNRQCLPMANITLLAKCLASPHNPLTLLTCLYYYRETMKTTNLEYNDSSAILNYFSDNLVQMQKDDRAQEWWIRDRLRSLPVFLTQAETHVSVGNTDMQVLVLPKGLPTDGIEQWAFEARRILLQEDHSQAKLYRFLEFSFMYTIDVYLHHILQTWNGLPLPAVKRHLEYIKDFLLCKPSGQDYNAKQTQLISLLRTLPVIPQNNDRTTASCFYSPFEKIFCTFCSAEDFPPQDFLDTSWKDFLELIGIKTKVTGEMFIRFAKQVARDGSHGLTKPIITKSRVLVDYLITEPIQWCRDDYNTISHIRFVVPYETQSHYTSVCKQHTENENLICFSNSISYRYEALSWTSLPLLPKEADPYSNYLSSKSEKEQKEAVLGIVHTPTLDSVILHCQNLCDSLKTCLEDSSRQESICIWLESYMENIYSYLNKNADHSSSTCRNRLYHTPIVYIPKLKTVVPAHQTVITIYPDQEIEPYLVKAPCIYGKFSDLFKYLGAANNPNYMLYVNVLAAIKETVGKNVLDDQYIFEWCAIVAALDNMFKTLMSDVTTKVPPRGTVLYLPSRNKQLIPSSLITVSDNFHQERRLHSSAPLQYFIGFKRLELKHGIFAISSIPEALRPKYLTQIIEEEIDMSEMTPENCHEAGQMESFLQSSHFIQGLLRLLKHTKTNISEILTPGEEAFVSSELRSVQVQAVSGLQTYLKLKGNRIDASAEAKRNHYHHEDGHWWIYFQIVPNAQQDWLKDMHNCVVRFLNRITNNCLGENVIIVLQMINMISNPEEISDMLDQMNIDAYDLPKDMLPFVFPPPGTYVQVELHHLLNCEFSTFGIHEYKCVAFELEDPELLDDDSVSDNNSPVYIYVRIRSKVGTNDTSSILTQLYEIDTGTEYITVPAFRLYKFIRPRSDTTSTDVVNTEGIKPSVSSQSQNKEMYSIRFQLREAWKLPETDRRRIIKRLLLRWHPDKNIGNEEFSTKMFLYVKECIRRLENRIPLDDEDVTDGHFQQARAYPDFTGSQYFEFCERMNRRSHSHQAFAQEYYSSDGHDGRGRAHRRSVYTQRSYYTHFDADERVYNDYGEARRWYRQAQVDLRHAVETIDTPGNPPIFNWICYMCHQVYLTYFIN